MQAGSLTTHQPRITHLDYFMKENPNPSLLRPWLSWASCHFAFPLNDSLVLNILWSDWLGQEVQELS